MPRSHVGMEEPIELLVKSGLWSRLYSPTQAIVPVLLHFSESANWNKHDVEISYRALMRYSGVRSFSSIRKGLQQLQEIHWLQQDKVPREPGPVQRVAHYTLTPYSDELMELANSIAAEHQVNIAAERELRRTQRKLRREATSALNRTSKEEGNAAPIAITRYKSLYT